MNMNKATAKLGKFFESTYRIPVLGDFLVRKMSRGMAYMTFHTPFWKMQKHHSIQGIKLELDKLAGLSDGELLISKENETSFEYLSSPCPYGFNRKDQQGVCDAAMDMNRHLFDLCGANLIIHESITSGAPRCRITLKIKDKD